MGEGHATHSQAADWGWSRNQWENFRATDQLAKTTSNKHGPNSCYSGSRRNTTHCQGVRARPRPMGPRGRPRGPSARGRGQPDDPVRTGRRESGSVPIGGCLTGPSEPPEGCAACSPCRNPSVHELTDSFQARVSVCDVRVDQLEHLKVGLLAFRNTPLLICKRRSNCKTLSVPR